MKIPYNRFNSDAEYHEQARETLYELGLQELYFDLLMYSRSWWGRLWLWLKY